MYAAGFATSETLRRTLRDVRVFPDAFRDWWGYLRLAIPGNGDAVHRVVELGFQHRARGAVRRSHARARRAGVLVQHVLFLLLVGVRVVAWGVHERRERRRRRENARRGDARGEHGGVVVFVRPRVRDGVLRERGRGVRRVHERQSRRRKARRVGAHAHVVHSHRRRTSRHRGRSSSAPGTKR